MHFLLMVIGENPEQQLAPYSAETAYAPQVDPALTPDVIVEDLQRYIDRLQQIPDRPGLLERAGGLREMLDDILQHGYEEGIRRHPERFSDYIQDRFECELDAQLRPVRGRNPQAMFDAHVMGGRWQGLLKLRPGATGAVGPVAAASRPQPGFADQCRRQDLDLAGSREAAADEAARQWDAEQKRAPHTLPFDQKRDAYIRDAQRDALLPDGIIENGLYHDLSVLDAQARAAHVDRIFQQMPPDTLITLYDCHC